MKLGPDTFTVSADGPNSSVAKKTALTLAAESCASMGKELIATNTNDGLRLNRFFYDVTFRCLDKNDPQLKRPEFTKSPDIVIEQRR
jgi:hypothetical protein